jgi:hypothetical protein
VRGGAGAGGLSAAGSAAGAAGTTPGAGSGGIAGAAGAVVGGNGGHGGTSGASGGAAGTAGSDAKKAPFAATGKPITAADRNWVWVDFPGTKCRDGSPAGLSVNFNKSSDKLVLFLEGGGGCFSPDTCLDTPFSPASIAAASRDPGNAGIFDRQNSENAVRDWNFVYVPYCTGDVFIGSNDEGKVNGVAGVQHFMGRPNLEAFFQRLVPTFPQAKQILLAGRSAGGFGALWSSEFVQWAFDPIPVTVIDDSGPPMSNEFLPKCLIDLEATMWRLDRTTLADCGADCTPDGDAQAQTLAHILKTIPARHVGLIETDADTVIRAFFGVGVNNGKNDCKGSLDLLIPQMSAELFQKGLLDYRTKVKPYPTFSTFYVKNSSQHMWILDSSFYGLNATAGGVRLVDWFRAVIEGKPGTHLGL